MKQSNTCRACGEEKKQELFSQSRGRENLCKKCRSNQRYLNGEYDIERLRKHKLRGSNVTLSVPQMQEMLSEGHCTYCGQDFTASELTLDHIFPIASRFNETDLGNVVPACRSCNAVKQDKHVLTFHRESDVFTDELYRQFVEHYTSVLFCGSCTADEIAEVDRFLFETAEEYERACTN